MDAYSSSEDLSVKARKPYTITKQRERWTEEEHNRFLEAVKLYGRAWQRIEEHIGTKTAVQIRSHAQKFFSKLEKEASMKGIPLGQAIDIEIPPPRPKRKPSNPYPRKTGTVGVTTVQPGLKEGKQVTLASSNDSERAFDREKVPLPEKPVGDCGQENAEQKRDDGKSSDALSLSHEASSALEASLDKNFMPKSAASLVRSPCDFGKFVSMKKHGIDKKACDGSHVTNGSYGKHEPDEPDVAETVHDNATERDRQFAKKCPRHVPVHILNGSLGARTPAFSSDVSYQEYAVHQVGVHGHPAFFASPAAPVERQEYFHASRFTSHQKVPSSCQPFPPSLNIQEDYFSFLQMSSTFSSLIISTLLQNPAAYAAASFAASFWPSTNAEASAESPAGSVGGFSPSPMNSAPSMAAIAAATVAAATAWWEAHGLLPLCAPMNGGFTYPAPASAAPTRYSQTAIVSQETEENNFHAYASQHKRQTVQELSEASPAPSLSLKSRAAAASVSKDSAAAKLNKRLTSHDDEQKGATETNQKNSVKSKNKKQVDRSSCGSNTTSSSEVETDALEKHENDDDGPKEPDQNHSCADTDNRGSRNLSYATDSWKEVSDEGRMAFQALFLREVLPQSFSPAHDEEHQKNDATEDRQNVVKSSDDASGLDLNSNTSESSSDHHGIENSGSRDEDNVKMLTIGLGQAKPKARRTGFKPYKRCSVEARVATANGEQEEGSKRIRLDGEASI